ncbi:transcription elongation factor S-II [Striga asiatica]|uniref:Transcription elongation factor S-II n=1 Tax=Striga asiatica TaxID=4170 RepID=A0A5A7RCY6_STRAF|nr:transcription elongation factor S-II [Striga asiatica]
MVKVMQKLIVHVLDWGHKSHLMMKIIFQLGLVNQMMTCLMIFFLIMMNMFRQEKNLKEFKKKVQDCDDDAGYTHPMATTEMDFEEDELTQGEGLESILHPKLRFNHPKLRFNQIW